MPVIQQLDPFGAGAEAASTFAGGYNDANAKALALARQKQLDDRDQANKDRDYAAGRSDAAEREREFGVTSAREEKIAEASVAHEQAATADQIQTTKFAAQLQPLIEQIDRLNIQRGKDDHTDALIKQRTDQLQNQVTQLQLLIAQKYGKQQAAAALALATAQVSHENAATAHEWASTYRDRAEADRGPKLSDDDLKIAGLRARDSLPPVLQNMLTQVESGQTDRVGLLTWARGNPQYRQYVPILAKLMTIPGTVGRASAAETRATAADDAQARGDLFSDPDLPKAKKLTMFQAAIGELDPIMQPFLLKAFMSGMSLPAIMTSVKNSATLTEDERTSALRALTLLANPNEQPAAASTAAPGLDLGNWFSGLFSGGAGTKTTADPSLDEAMAGGAPANPGPAARPQTGAPAVPPQLIRALLAVSPAQRDAFIARQGPALANAIRQAIAGMLSVGTPVGPRSAAPRALGPTGGGFALPSLPANIGLPHVTDPTQ